VVYVAAVAHCRCSTGARFTFSLVLPVINVISTSVSTAQFVTEIVNPNACINRYVDAAGSATTVAFFAVSLLFLVVGGYSKIAQSCMLLREAYIFGD